MVSKPAETHSNQYHPDASGRKSPVFPALTRSEEVVDDPHDLLIGHLHVRVLVQLAVFTVFDERIGDVTDVVLKHISRQLSVTASAFYFQNNTDITCM